MPNEKVQVTHRSGEDLKTHLNQKAKLLGGQTAKPSPGDAILEMFPTTATPTVVAEPELDYNQELVCHMMSAEVQAALAGANYEPVDNYAHLRNHSRYATEQARWRARQPFVVREADWAVLGIESPDTTSGEV